MAKNKTKKINLILTAFIVCGFLLALYIFFSPKIEVNTQLDNAKMSVHFIDVGQGDCILIKSQNSSILVDAGDNNKSDIVMDYLKRQKVNKLDLVIGTHPHADHIGGLDVVIDNFDISKIIMPQISQQLMPTTKTYKDVLSSISKKGLKITKPNQGEKIQFDTFYIEIISDNIDYDNLNDYSVVTKIVCDDFKVLLTGDIEKDAEKKLFSKDIKADILKSPHHGSNTSNTLEFIKKVNPKYAIITVGAGNKYSHPHNQVLHRFSQQGINVFRTDKNGDIIISTDGKEYEIATQKN
jgi:competence protein ComEC